MTKTLILMRHAKSSWNSPELSDHDRPLNGRGRCSALALGDWLRKTGYLPQSVLCSSALRTRQTLAGLNLDAETRFTERLYHAGADQMMRVLIEAETDCVLMIAHNPGIAEFAERLLAHPPDHPRFADYPTGATLVAVFDIDTWAATAWHSGQSRAFITPRDLTD